MARTLLRPAILLLFLCPVATATPRGVPESATPRVVIVTVDGLRPDAAAAAGALNLAALARRGAAARSGAAVAPTLTLPSHIAMATGLTLERHGIRSNRELGRDVGVPTVFSAARAAGFGTALYFGKAKLIALAPGGSADLVRGPGPGDAHWDRGAAAELAARFTEDFPGRRPALAWIHLREPDLAGHDAGWMSPPYLEAVREADRALGVILGAIDASPSYATTTVILTADHGGEKLEHWGDHASDWRVPWVCRGPRAKPGTVIREARTIDVAPTALVLLGLPPLPEMQGRAVPECVGR